MTAITLQAIKAQQNLISEMIAKFEAQAKINYLVPEKDIVLYAGESYAGIILDEKGNPGYHLILLPGEKEAVNWAAAKEWAAGQGGELPTRREQSLLFANLKDHFKSSCYWSGELNADSSGYAWFQFFDLGSQYGNDVSAELRARAVRRLIID
ncbi:MAG: hypothetical protein CML16_14905 [Pusillimonas sp.]|nr:hypothetical protein [Pusillimonas sp.]MBC42808.1 hypothetical protein [Pusillimonas sp.]|tara:strand:+ start:17860 stop:18318 length:459 start_codon:yes stop_codon:yes gene_type:complete